MITIGDLKPTGGVQPLEYGVLGRPSAKRGYAVASSLIACLVAAAGVAWLNLGDMRAMVARADRPAIDGPPRSFPAWVEVPHLADPIAGVGRDDGDGRRSFLHPQPVDAVDKPVFLPPRANPRLPLIGLAPLDAERWTHGRPATWNEAPDRPALATPTSVPPDAEPPNVVATRGPGTAQPTRIPGGTPAPLADDATTTPVNRPEVGEAPVAERIAPIVELGPSSELTVSHALVSVEAVHDQGSVNAGTLAPSATTPARPASVVTLDSALQPQPYQGGPVVRLLPTREQLVATQAPVPAKRAWSPRLRPARPPSVTGAEAGGERGARIDAGPVARASPHRARPPVPAQPSGAPEPWILPPALSPTD